MSNDPHRTRARRDRQAKSRITAAQRQRARGLIEKIHAIGHLRDQQRRALP